MKYANSRKRRAPDFENLRTIFLNGTPKDVPLYEVLVDMEVMEAIVAHPIARDLGKKQDEGLVEFYFTAGFDYVPTGPIIPLRHRRRAVDRDSDDPSDQRNWQIEHGGAVQGWDDFERFPWPEGRDVNYEHVERLSGSLPAGMKLVAQHDGIYENVSFLPGVETLCYLIYDEPKLVAALFEKVGSLFSEVYKNLLEFDGVGAVLLADDLGHNMGTFLPPDMLREHVFPWYRRIAEAARERDKPFVLHSCGNVAEVVDDIIDAGVNALHSFEDKIEPVWVAKQRYGDRVALLGGIDVNLLCLGTEDEVRSHVRMVLEQCGAGGYALGSGNSLTNYMRIENILAMFDELHQFNRR